MYVVQEESAQLAEEDWQLYLSCSKLPHPGLPSQMTDYLNEVATTSYSTLPAVVQACQVRSDAQHDVEQRTCSSSHTIRLPT